ncbi:hypothetical protein CesoFtcFv8_027870 [Champsocephalus esox]|uniref:Uncharacterized protein n=1 Tax=Champsocephalus esox TaxID=159716 RepID=A0AAN8G858_9TELE|nr:hypothetical protein CesoFtcFv8_027870 [Champsocephalus esox]
MGPGTLNPPSEPRPDTPQVSGFKSNTWTPGGMLNQPRPPPLTTTHPPDILMNSVPGSTVYWEEKLSSDMTDS